MQINITIFINTAFYIVFLSSLFCVILNLDETLLYKLTYLSGVSLFVFLSLFSKKPRSITIIFFIIFLCLNIIFMIHIFVYEDIDMLYFAVSIINIYIGWIAAVYFLKINFKLLFYISAIFIILFILYNANNNALLIGNTEYLNRTYYTLPMVLLLIATCYKDYLTTKKIDISVIIVFFFVALLSFSRSSMVFPLIGIILYFFFKKTYTFLFFAIPFLFYILYYIGIENLLFINDVIERFEERGLSSGRFEFWMDHLTNLTPLKLLIGYNFEEVHSMLSKYFESGTSHTLHSSLFHIHVIYGIVGLFVFLIFFINLIRISKLIKTNSINRVLFLTVILTFLSKTLFETVLFVQRYDFIFYAILFHSSFLLIGHKKQLNYIKTQYEKNNRCL